MLHDGLEYAQRSAAAATLAPVIQRIQYSQQWWAAARAAHSSPSTSSIAGDASAAELAVQSFLRTSATESHLAEQILAALSGPSREPHAS